jgi:hypothetical protein
MNERLSRHFESRQSTFAIDSTFRHDQTSKIVPHHFSTPAENYPSVGEIAPGIKQGKAKFDLGSQHAATFVESQYHTSNCLLESGLLRTY